MSPGPHGSSEGVKPTLKKRGGQPGNTNAFKLKRPQAVSAKCRTGHNLVVISEAETA